MPDALTHKDCRRRCVYASRHACAAAMLRRHFRERSFIMAVLRRCRRRIIDLCHTQFAADAARFSIFDAACRCRHADFHFHLRHFFFRFRFASAMRHWRAAFADAAAATPCLPAPPYAFAAAPFFFFSSGAMPRE
jgi:hypothetical protein